MGLGEEEERCEQRPDLRKYFSRQLFFLRQLILTSFFSKWWWPISDSAMTLLQSASYLIALSISPPCFKICDKVSYIWWLPSIEDLLCRNNILLLAWSPHCIPQPPPFPACSIYYKYFKICPHIQIILAHTRRASQIYIYMYYAHCAAGVANNYRILNFKFRISTGGQSGQNR